MEFSDLALAKLLQSAPELGSLVLNFSELSDQLEDSSMQVGVFLLKTGRGLALLPVVGKGDSIFPLDSIFFQEEGRFVPLTKASIAEILSMPGSTMGSAKKIPQQVNRNPSVYSLITPPRTGKYVYASSSRLVEFLAMLPSGLQTQTLEKFAAEQSVYKVLDRLFGLQGIVDALKAGQPQNGLRNTGPSGLGHTKQETASIITSPQQVAALADEAMAQEFISQGFVLKGSPTYTRTAVMYDPYNTIGQFRSVNPAVDGGKDYDVVMSSGTSREAFLPKYHAINGIRPSQLVSVFTDGSYVRGDVIVAGDELDRHEVLSRLFDECPPKLLRDLDRDEEFLLMTSSGEFLGPFRAQSVTLTHRGVEVKVCGCSKFHSILGYNNFTKELDSVGDTLFVMHNTVVIPLGADLTCDVERSINRAADVKQILTAQFLGSEIDLRYDGVEFSAGGNHIGALPEALKYLVEKEHIDALPASNFLKQAQETKFLKIFLSKEAASTDVNPADIAQYGTTATPALEPAKNGAIGASFMNSVQDAAALNDAQILESTIISQLLEVPDLFEYIQEYLPEIEESVNKLGRLIFLIRVKIDQLGEAMDSDNVFALISQIKNVYKQLGDSAVKLRNIAGVTQNFQGDKKVGQSNG